MDEIPEGWKVVDRTPSGLHRLLPADYEPEAEHRNLMHNRHPQNIYVIRAWVIVGFGLIFLGFGFLFYLWAS